MASGEGRFQRGADRPDRDIEEVEAVAVAGFESLQVEMLGGDLQQKGFTRGGGSGGTDSYLKARSALTVYQAQERQLAIQKKRGTLVDRARAEALVFRLARQERDVWVTWPARVAALMAAQEEKQSGKKLGPVDVHVNLMTVAAMEMSAVKLSSVLQ